MFHLVPLAGPRREMADGQAQADLVRQFLHRYFPQARTVAVAPPAVGRDQDLPRPGEAPCAHLLPPTADARRGEEGRVMVDADTDPALVVRDVVDPVRDGLAQFLILEVVNADFLRRPFGAPLPAWVLEIPHQLLLLRVHRDHRLAALLKAPRLGVDVLELGVAVGMLPPLARLAVGLQAVAGFVQEGGHRAVTDGVALPGQFPGQRPRALASPPQGRFRVAARQRLNQALQCRRQVGVQGGQRFAPRSSLAQARADWLVGVLLPMTKFVHPQANGIPSQAGRLGDRANAAVSEFLSFAGRPLPPRALIQDGGQRFKLPPDSFNGVGIVHPRVMADQQRFANPKLATLLFRGPLPSAEPPRGVVCQQCRPPALLIREGSTSLHLGATVAVWWLVETRRDKQRRQKTTTQGGNIETGGDEPSGSEVDHAPAGAQTTAQAVTVSC